MYYRQQRSGNGQQNRLDEILAGILGPSTWLRTYKISSQPDGQDSHSLISRIIFKIEKLMNLIVRFRVVTVELVTCVLHGIEDSNRIARV